MPDSVREQIVDAVVSAFSNIVAGSTYVSSVDTVLTELPENWAEYPQGNCPAVWVADMDAVEEPQDLVGYTGAVMTAELTLVVAAVIYSNTSDNKAARNDLMRDLKKAVFNDNTLDTLNVDRLGVTVTRTSRGVLPKYDHFVLEFRLRYPYTYADGG